MMNPFNKGPKPRRAAKRSLKRPIIIFVAALIGLAMAVSAAAVVLPQRMGMDNQVAVPVLATEEATEATPYERSIPSATPNELGPGPKGMPTEKSTKSARKAEPTKTYKPKPKVTQKAVPPPKVIGTRYACTTLNIRAAAGLKALVVDKAPPRTEIKIMNRALGKFRMVRWEDKNRWAYQPCLWMKPPPKIVMKKETSPQQKSTPAPEKKSTPAPKKKTSSSPNIGSTAVWNRLAECESSGTGASTPATATMVDFSSVEVPG